MNAYLTAMKRVLGPAHPDTLTSMMNLATALNLQGKYAEAEEMNREVLEARKRVLGPEHPDTLKSMNNLAMTLNFQGQYAEAEKMCREVLEAMKRVLGPEHPDTLTSMMNLATALNLQGKYAEAEEMYREVLKTRKRVLGPEHPDTLSSMNNLANSLARQLRIEEALAVIDEAIKHNPRQRQFWSNHAYLSFVLDQADQGRKSLAEAMKRHPNPQWVQAYVQQEANRYQRLLVGKQLIGQELDAGEKYIQRAQYHAHMHTFDKAKKDVESALKLDPTLAAKGAYHMLAQICEKQKDWAGKLDAYKQWAAAAPEDPNALNSYAWELLTSKDEALQDAKAALPIAEKTVELTQQKQPAILDTLALAQFKTGMIAEAIATQETALGLLPPNHPSRAEFKARIDEYKQALEKKEEPEAVGTE